jgi:Ni/Co efflux regulator RcnB
LADSKWAVKPTTKAAASTEVPKEEEAVQRQAQVPRAPAPEGEEVNETETSTRVPDEESASSAAAAAAPPSGPANATARPPAVSGDRTATGGVRKPKLTEEELTAKLAAAKERSQNVAAAHARAQADAASFEERERVAKAKREKDRVQRKAMDNEREKNRQHKMAVIGRREWDLGKDEQDFVTQNGRGGGRRFQSGTTPQQQYQTEQDDLRQYEWHDDRGRGRGGQGRGRGGGRGRGRDSNPPQQKSGWSAESDFPALPGSSSTPTTTKPVSGEPLSTESRPNPRRLDSEGDGGGGTWAEQVESSEAA